ncbi:YncE family protein [Magnetovibrio sp. PR-2]|uniref:YncE family protein n=1 Tax=Magnetovibrio sp. PR-2 TaxID=3120356 RepID=UPI002FCDE858
MKVATALLFTVSLSVGFPAFAGSKVYVPMGSADEVIVIDTDQDKIVGSIKAVTESHGLAGSSDGKFLIAGSLDEFDPDSQTPPKPTAVSQDDHDAHHASDSPTAMNGNGAVSFLSIIRTEDSIVERRVSVPGSVHHTLITPDDKFAIATHPGEEGISIVDLNSYEVKSVKTGPIPNYAVTAPDGRAIYVSNAGNNTVSMLDTKRWILRWNIEVGDGPEHMVISDDGKFLFVNNTGDGTVSMISLPKGTVTQTFKVGGDIHGIDLSDDGNTLFIAGREEDKVVAIDVLHGQITSKSLSPSPYHLSAIDGTEKLYISSAEDDKIWVIDQESLQTINEIPVSDRAHQMVVVQ